MSMMCSLVALSARQMAAFREHPELATDFARTSVADQLDADLAASFTGRPDLRAQYDAARREMLAQDPAWAKKQAALDAARPRLAALGPFQARLSLGKSWNILHFLLIGHTDDAPSPGDALVSGTPVGEDLGYGPARLHDVAETRAFSDFLAPLDPERVLSRLDFAELARRRVYPIAAVPDVANADAWRAALADDFSRLKTYVPGAAARGDGLMIWLS